MRKGTAVIAILFIALVARLAVFSVVAAHPDRAITPDSKLYMDLGRDFVDAYLVSREEHLWKSIWRTPLYPLFCGACFLGLGDRVQAILIGQMVVSLATILLLYVVVRKWIGKRSAILAALLLALDPLSITYVNYVLSEILFTFLFLAGAAWWLNSLKQPRDSGLTRVRSGWFAGLSLGLSVLARPITTYVLAFVLPVDLVLRRWLHKRLFAPATLAIVLGFVLPVAVLVGRNFALTGSGIISSIEGTNALYYRAAGAVAEETGRNRVDVATEFKQAMKPKLASVENPARRSSLEKSEGLKILLAHPRGAFLSALKGGGKLLFGPGDKSLSRLLYGPQRFSEPSRLEPALKAYQFGFLALAYFAAMIGLAHLWKNRNFTLIAVLATLGAYLLLISSGGEAYSRFRTPLMPFMCLFAGCGLCRIGAVIGSTFSGAPNAPVSEFEAVSK